MLNQNHVQTKYASMLAEKVERHGTHVWLINTGGLDCCSCFVHLL